MDTRNAQPGSVLQKMGRRIRRIQSKWIIQESIFQKQTYDRKRNKKRIFVGLDAKLMDISQRISPMHYEKLFPIFTLPITILRNKKPLK